MVGGLQAGEMGSFTLNSADMSQDAIKWFQNQSGLLDEQDYTSEDGQNAHVYPTLLVMDDQEFSTGQARKFP